MEIRKLEIEDYIYQEKLNDIIKYIVNKIETKYKLYSNLVPELKNMINYDNSNDSKQEDILLIETILSSFIPFCV